MAGNAGRYISMEKGPIADNSPNIKIIDNLLRPSMMPRKSSTVAVGGAAIFIYIYRGQKITPAFYPF